MDEEVTPPETLERIGKLLELCNRTYRATVTEWNKLEIVFRTLFGDDFALQSTAGPAFNTTARKVLPLSSPKVMGNGVEELTLSRIEEYVQARQTDIPAKDKASIKKAQPVQVASSSSHAPQVFTELDPAMMRVMLDECRKNIRNSEGDKAGSGNGRIQAGAVADCADMLLNHPSVAIGIEYQAALSEFSRHEAYSAWAKRVHGYREEHGRLVTVYEASPYHPFGPAFVEKLGCSSAEAGLLMQVYTKTNDPLKHAAPISARFPTPLPQLRSLDLSGQLLVIGSSWLDLNATDGFTMTMIQQQLTEAAYASKVDSLIMLCRLDKEFGSRKANVAGGKGSMAVPSELLFSVAGCWERVSFVPGVRPHNGMFWMIASGRRPIKVTVPDKLFLRSIQDWTVAYAFISFYMYRGNVLKNAATLCGIRGVCDVQFRDLLGQPMYKFVALKPGLDAWGLRNKKSAAVTRALDVGDMQPADYYEPLIIEAVGEENIE